METPPDKNYRDGKRPSTACTSQAANMEAHNVSPPGMWPPRSFSQCMREALFRQSLRPAVCDPPTPQDRTEHQHQRTKNPAQYALVRIVPVHQLIIDRNECHKNDDETTLDRDGPWSGSKHTIQPFTRQVNLPRKPRLALGLPHD